MGSSLSFAAEAVSNPTRYYHRPHQVVQDRRLNRNEKLAILEAWELEARSLAAAGEESTSGDEPDMLADVLQARIALGTQAEVEHDGTSATKHGVRRKYANH